MRVRKPEVPAAQEEVANLIQRKIFNAKANEKTNRSETPCGKTDNTAESQIESEVQNETGNKTDGKAEKSPTGCFRTADTGCRIGQAGHGSTPGTGLQAGSVRTGRVDELRRIENALVEAENILVGDTGRPVTLNPVSAALIADITELLEELIDTTSPKLASTISRLAYVLCEVMPDLQAVSKRADITLCRKCGVTFGWDRRTEAERAVRSGKYQKSTAVS